MLPENCQRELLLNKVKIPDSQSSPLKVSTQNTSGNRTYELDSRRNRFFPFRNNNRFSKRQVVVIVWEVRDAASQLLHCIAYKKASPSHAFPKYKIRSNEEERELFEETEFEGSVIEYFLPLPGTLETSQAVEVICEWYWTRKPPETIITQRSSNNRQRKFSTQRFDTECMWKQDIWSSFPKKAVLSL